MVNLIVTTTWEGEIKVVTVQEPPDSEKQNTVKLDNGQTVEVDDV